MNMQRFPVMVWQNFDRNYTATLLDTELAAHAQSRRDAVNQIEEYLLYLLRKDSLGTADCSEPTTETFTVSLRPEYRHEERVFACDEQIQLRVVCVWGKNESGTLQACLPMLQIRFYFHASDKLKALVEHYVREKLSGCTPREIARYLHPFDFELTEVLIRGFPDEKPSLRKLEQNVLEAVADALDDRTMRKQTGKPYEREVECNDLAQRLCFERAHILLVGEAGVGKTAVLGEAVRRAVILENNARDAKASNGDDDERKIGRRYWLTQAGRLIAGMKYLGMWQERCEEIIQQLAECNGVVCFETLLDLLRLGGSEPAESIAAFLIPYMQRGEVRVVAECSPTELDACRRLMPAFVDLFQIQTIAPFDKMSALRVLESVSAALQQNQRISADRDVVEQTHRLFSRFRPYDAFPGQAVAFLKDLFQQAKRRKAARVSSEDVVAAFLRKSGLPELFLRDTMTLKQADVLATFKKQVVGQEPACAAASGLVLTFKAGLNDPHRPLGVFLFCGPTGVGKTELARALSKFFFGHGDDAEQRLVRLDMSEFSGGDAASRLVTGPDGGPSDFIQRLRRQPFAVVLLDEIEKASPEVFDVLMGVFDEGRLSDPYGRITRFTSAVIVMTSNLGAEKQEAAGFQTQRTPSYDNEALRFFRPEFFNRIDAVISFAALKPETIRLITEKELESIAAREGFKSAGLQLEWNSDVVARLAETGFDRRYGARPLQRALERAVIAPLSRYLVEHPTLRDARLRLVLHDDAVAIEAG